jgi:hypothetical protein
MEIKITNIPFDLRVFFNKEILKDINDGRVQNAQDAILTDITHLVGELEDRILEYDLQWLRIKDLFNDIRCLHIIDYNKQVEKE